MKKILTVGVALVSMASFAIAGQVNPTSNVLGDTAATGNTLVLRDSSGNMAIVAADIGTGAITTAKILQSSVTTAKLYLDLPTLQVVCVTTQKILGKCTGITIGTGLCDSCL